MRNTATILIRTFILITASLVICPAIYELNGQPPTMQKYTDDLELCFRLDLNNVDLPVGIRQFCTLATSSDPNLVKTTRDDLIELVRGQIDEFYKDHKNGKREKNRWFQTILDILEVGAATTIDFINGERAKSVIASGLIGLKGGRSSFNKNFESIGDLEKTCEMEQVAGIQLTTIQFGAVIHDGQVFPVNKAAFEEQTIGRLRNLAFSEVKTDADVAEINNRINLEGWTFICDSQIYVSNTVMRVIVAGKKTF